MDKKSSRREFLARTAAAAAAFSIVPRQVLGGPGQTPPSEKTGDAVVGLGRGGGFISGGGKTLAVCDVDKRRMEEGMKRGGEGCKGYTDFRYILDRKDITFVKVLTPPHWHTLISIAAAQAGKDVFCEKPLTRTIAEGRAFVEAIRRHGCQFQYGAHSEGTPADTLRRAAQSGLLGTPLTVYQTEALGCNFKVAGWTGMVNQVPQPVPDYFDWNMFVGPSPMKPYHPHRTHGSFRGYWDYDGGGLSDMAPHILNSIITAIGKEHTSPVEVETDAPPAHDDAVGIWYSARLKYDDGLTLVLDSGCKPGAPGRDDSTPLLYAEGPKGRLLFAREGRDRVPRTDPPGLLDDLKHANVSRDTSRLQGLPGPLRTVIHAHRVVSIPHLVNLSVRTGRKLRFDPVKEEVVGDEEANRLVNPPMRAPWHLAL